MQNNILQVQCKTFNQSIVFIALSYIDRFHSRGQQPCKFIGTKKVFT